MDKPAKKFAIVIKAGVQAGKAINMASHLSAELGSLAPELGGKEVLDASGVKHAGLPIYPNVILAASAEEFPQAVAKARQMADTAEVVFLDYPEEGFTTSTDEAYRSAIALLSTEAIVVQSFLVYGPRSLVNAVTKGLMLWK
ncbi:MAG: DUF2000 domain-containing protein [Pirellulales bacterium]